MPKLKCDILGNFQTLCALFDQLYSLGLFTGNHFINRGFRQKNFFDVSLWITRFTTVLVSKLLKHIMDIWTRHMT